MAEGVSRVPEKSDCKKLEQKIKQLEKENNYLRFFKFGIDNMPGSRVSIDNRAHFPEEQLEKSQKGLIHADRMISLGVLVSGVAHEINNPNNFIMLNTPILEEAWQCIVPIIERYYKENGDFSLAGLTYSDVRDEIPLLFEGIKEGAERIHRIVHDLKNFVRQDETDMEQFVNINNVIEDSIRLTGNLIKEKTAHFTVEYGVGLPMLKGNRQNLQQVFINLVQNACQALPSKEKGIFVASSFDHSTGNIMVDVRDEGVGISQKYLDRIMDPFFTTKRGDGGTGLGLAVSSNIVKAHGGTMDVVSEMARGSRFRVILPSIISEKNAKILVMDDDPGVVKLLLETLGKSGLYSFRAVVDLKTLFLSIGQEQPHVIVLDIHMDHMDDSEICRLLIKKAVLLNIRILILTEFTEPSRLEEIAQKGFENILIKPFDVEDFRKAIDKMLEEDQ